MPSKQITTHLKNFLLKHPKGTAKDFAHYLSAIAEMQRLFHTMRISAEIQKL